MAYSISKFADIVVQAADGNLLAIVEVKNRENLTPVVAAQLRRNLMAHGQLNIIVRYFLIVSQDVGYLWDQKAHPSFDIVPSTLEFPMTQVIERYLPSFVGAGRLSNAQLELAVTQWLWDIAGDVGGRPRMPEDILAQAPDFLRLLRGALVSTEIEF